MAIIHTILRWFTILTICLMGMAASQQMTTAQNQPEQMSFDCSTVSEIPKDECEALVDIFNSTGGPDWTNKSGWLVTTTPCSWFRVACLDGHVDKLEFTKNNLIGTLPWRIRNLTNLRVLIMPHAQINSVPSEIGNLSQLTEINFWGGELSDLPSSIGDLSNLTHLGLGHNNLTNIPPEIGDLSSLLNLDMGANQIESVPVELFNLSNLTSLSLSYNQLINIPAEVRNLSNLTKFDLSHNQLETIPVEIGNLSNLNELYLEHNQLATIPSAIGNLSELIIFNIEGNKLGEIPSEMGRLSELTTLTLKHNQLTTIPSEIGQLAKLTRLSLDYNQLNDMPATIGNLSELTWLSISNNQLRSIPPEIGNLAKLSELYLWDNQLEQVPPEIFGASAITKLDIGANQLGSVPSQIDALSQLTKLWLYGNQLSEIPTEIGNLSNLESFWANSNQLSDIPSEIGNLSNLKNLWLYSNKLERLPLTIMNLRDLVELELAYNKIIVKDHNLVAYLQEKDSDWGTTQTIAPEGPQVEAVSDTKIRFTWQPVAFQEKGGYYKITTVSGSFEKTDTVLNLAANEHEIDGLDPNTTYIVSIQTYTPPHDGGNPDVLMDNQTNELWSLHSKVVEVTTLKSTPTPTPTWTPTPTPTLTRTPTPTDIPTSTHTWTPTPTDTSIPTLTWTPLPTNTPTPTHTWTPTPIDTPTLTPIPTSTDTPTPTNTAIPTPTHTPIPTSTPTMLPTSTSTLPPTQIPTQTPTQTSTITLTPIPPTDTLTLTPTSTATSTPANTATPIPTDTSTSTPTDTSVPTFTPTDTPTAIPTSTPTQPPTFTLTPIDTPVPTDTPTQPPTWTPTDTPTQPPTFTLTPIDTPVPTDTPTQPPTWTPTDTPTQPPTFTLTPIPPTQTPTPILSQPDNDSCSSSHSLVLDARPTSYVFDTADSDWFIFTAPTPGTYRIEVTIPNGSRADVDLYYYTECGSSEEDRFTETFSPGTRLNVEVERFGQKFYIQVKNSDARDFGPDVSYDLSVRQISSQDEPNNGLAPGPVIVVAGRYRNGDSAQDNINQVALDAYRLFEAKGRTDDDIFFLATDTSLPGYDYPATEHNLKSVITEKAKERLQDENVSKVLTLYLVDHGDKNKLYLDRNNQEILTPEDLDQWLATLEADIPDILVNVFIEACHAGSFITRPGGTISKEGRVIITSSNEDYDAFVSRHGAAFSDSFITFLHQEHNLSFSYHMSKERVQDIHGNQEPWIDADGDGEPNENADIALASQRSFTEPGSLGDDWPPYIAATSRTGHLSGIQAEVRHKGGNSDIKEVWAVVYPPGYADLAGQAADEGDGILNEELLDVIEFEANGEAHYIEKEPYTGFTQMGVYRVVIQARDINGLVAHPVTIEVDTRHWVYLPMISR